VNIAAIAEPCEGNGEQKRWLFCILCMILPRSWKEMANPIMGMKKDQSTGMPLFL